MWISVAVKFMYSKLLWKLWRTRAESKKQQGPTKAGARTELKVLMPS